LWGKLIWWERASSEKGIAILKKKKKGVLGGKVSPKLTGAPIKERKKRKKTRDLGILPERGEGEKKKGGY